MEARRFVAAFRSKRMDTPTATISSPTTAASAGAKRRTRLSSIWSLDWIAILSPLPVAKCRARRGDRGPPGRYRAIGLRPGRVNALDELGGGVFRATGVDPG